MVLNRTIKGLINKIIATEFKSYLRRKFYAKESNLNNRQYNELKSFPRFTRTSVLVEGREIIIPDSASFLFMQKEIFEQHIYKFQTAKNKPYIIDGGANIGLASIYLKLLYPDSDVVAFEPDPTIFDILKSNMEAYSFNGIELIQKGIWNEEASIPFKSEGADAGLITTLDETLTATNTINVTPLKPYLNKTVDFLKLDIEGAETIVLKDIEDDLDRVERIFVEYHSFVGQKQTLNEIINILTKANFRIYMSIPGNNSLNSPLMGLKSYNNMDFQLNIFGYKEGNQ